MLLNAVVIYSQDADSTFASRSIIFRNLRINLQVNTEQTFSLAHSTGKNHYFKNNSIAAGLEWVVRYKNSMNYGIGFLYQFPSSINALEGKLGNLPIYTYIDFPLTNRESFPLQLSFRLGPSFLQTDGKIDKKGHGIYHAIGLTTEINRRIQVKLLYSTTYGEITIGNSNYDVTNESMNFILSLRI